jgi:hypothetical protein
MVSQRYGRTTFTGTKRIFSSGIVNPLTWGVPLCLDCFGLPLDDGIAFSAELRLPRAVSVSGQQQLPDICNSKLIGAVKKAFGLSRP